MIEPLEPRIAPATVAVTGNTATWTDFDGDKVTMKWTTGNAPLFLTDDVGSLGGLIVKRISFDSASAGAKVTIAVKAAGGGDGRIDLGRVDASGVALAAWSSPRATIAEIDAGDTVTSFKSFVSGALGVHAVSLFSGAGGDGVSRFEGAIGTVTILGDIAATKLELDAAPGTKIAKVEVKGSLLGTAAASGLAGVLEVNADVVGSIIVGGSILGGNFSNTGVLQNFGSVGSVTIKGSLVGGEVSGTGTINLADVKALTIGGNVQGGGAASAGKIGGGSVGTLTLGGDLIGGIVADTGVIGFATGGRVLIKGSVIGTKMLGSGSNSLTGALSFNGEVGSVTVLGDLLGGSNASGVTVSYNGALIFGSNVKTLTIKGNVLGTDGLPAAILAKGTTPLADGNFNAIGRLTIGGNVTLAYIAAGQGIDSTALGSRIGNAENSDAGIGSVSVGGNWLHSNLTAGINDTGSLGVDITDTRSPGDAGRMAVIGSILIRGDILDNGALTGTSGFAAEKIGKLTASGQKLFTAGSPTKTLNWDQKVIVREV